MNRIMIIGSGGAGKSTLARRLGKRLGISVYHLDALFWKPGWKETERSVFEQLQTEIVEKDSWIIDGNYSGTMDLRLEKADTVIFLRYSTIRCLYGVLKRRIHYHGKSRPDVGAGCPEKLDWQFLSWVAGFNRKKAPALLKRLQKASGKRIYTFTLPAQLETYLKELK